MIDLIAQLAAKANDKVPRCEDPSGYMECLADEMIKRYGDLEAARVGRREIRNGIVNEYEAQYDLGAMLLAVWMFA